MIMGVGSLSRIWAARRSCAVSSQPETRRDWMRRGAIGGSFPGRICTTKRRRSIFARQPYANHAKPTSLKENISRPRIPENNPLVLDHPFSFLHLFLADPWAPAWLIHHWPQ